MTEHPERREHKWRLREGYTPSYRAFHEVYITKDLGQERNEELRAFIDKHITEYKGKIEDKHGIPLMLFERNQDAHDFANELSARLNIPKEHITVKAEKYCMWSAKVRRSRPQKIMDTLEAMPLAADGSIIVPSSF
jgi:hypothetical protein